jgi:methyl-accepting chemotaxis protein
LGYLVENPDAQDTLEGIVEWWLLDRKIQRGITQVKETLEKMIADGLIIERKGSDARVRYVINENRRDEIAELLKQATDQPE